VPLARNNKDTPEMRAFTHVSTEFTHRVEPHEPLSAFDQVVVEMFAVPPALQVFHKTPTHDTYDREDEMSVVASVAGSDSARCPVPDVFIREWNVFLGEWYAIFARSKKSRRSPRIPVEC
jgi:hypothetical protein